ncbi:MAG: protease HtpX [Succinivibrionaceae bacterium]
MIRIIFYALTMAGILLVVNVIAVIVMNILGINISGGSYGALFFFSLIIGMSGSLISLFLSKTMVKRSMGVHVITNPSNQAEKWLLETISGLARAKGVKMPEVGIYQSPDMNAFATGWNKNNALVAVSTALLDKMEQDEIEAVLGHEMSHVANGDMVTMCLLQGILNTFITFISYILAQIILGALRGNNRESNNGFSYYLIVHVLQMILGFLANIAVCAFSRWREYRADAGSAKVLGARSMIKALERLGNMKNVEEEKPEGVQALCVNSFSINSLFATHPPLEDRIKALKKL